MGKVTIIEGPKVWGPLTVDEEGTREYKVTITLETDDPKDGPFTIDQTPGLPQYGDSWAFGNDNDDWATRKQTRTIKPRVSEENTCIWDCEYTFSTKYENKRCKSQPVEEPLNIPPRISGSYHKYQEEATVDRFNLPIVNSAWEQFRGPQVEFDKNRPSIKIVINVPSFEDVAVAYSMLDTVNDAPIFGFDERCVKLSNIPWERKFYGDCYIYFELTLEFDIRPDGFDRDLLDEGTKVLHGHWDKATYVVDNIGGAIAPANLDLSYKTGQGGTLTDNTTYSYVVTSVVVTSPTGVTPITYGESLPSPIASIVVPNLGGLTSVSISIRWNAVPGAVGYNIYGRTGISIPSLSLINPTIITVPTSIDNGSSLIGSQHPPATDTTGGATPNPSNPTHFDRFKDRNGENCKVVLDGNGLPAGVLIANNRNTKLYINIDQIEEIGTPVTNTLFWSILNNVVPRQWDSTVPYVIGDAVDTVKAVSTPSQDGPDYIALLHTWVCVQNNTNVNPETDTFSSHWKVLPNGINNAGGWNQIAGYTIGDYVQLVSPAGKIHVEKYNQSNFLLINPRLPVNFDEPET